MEARVRMASTTSTNSTESLEALLHTCRDTAQPVGEIACFDILVKTKPVTLLHNVSQNFFKVLESIFELLIALGTARSNVEKKYVQDCLKYYGLCVSTELFSFTY